jgi:hypothetical protein
MTFGQERYQPSGYEKSVSEMEAKSLETCWHLVCGVTASRLWNMAICTEPHPTNLGTSPHTPRPICGGSTNEQWTDPKSTFPLKQQEINSLFKPTLVGPGRTLRHSRWHSRLFPCSSRQMKSSASPGPEWSLSQWLLHLQSLEWPVPCHKLWKGLQWWSQHTLHCTTWKSCPLMNTDHQVWPLWRQRHSWAGRGLPLSRWSPLISIAWAQGLSTNEKQMPLRRQAEQIMFYSKPPAMFRVLRWNQVKLKSSQKLIFQGKLKNSSQNSWSDVAISRCF